MKKYAVALMVLSMASLAMGSVSFDLGATDPIEINQGESVTIPVAVTGAGSFAGLNLYLNSVGPFEISSFVVQGAGSGTVWETNSSPATIYTAATAPEIIPAPSIGVVFVSTQTGSVAVNGSAVVAKVTISVPADAPLGTLGLLTTDGAGGVTDPSTLADAFGGDVPVGQATIGLKVVPEPTTALLLLGALPLLRRRHA